MSDERTQLDIAICRPARVEDAALIAAGNVAMALETEGRRLAPTTVRKGVEAVFRDPSLGRYFVAEVAGRVVGQLMITFEWSDWRNASIWWIQSVYVHPDYRRRGIFRQLYRNLLDEARAAGKVAAIRLYVERDNAVAQQVYADLGLHDTGYHVWEAAVGGGEGV